MNKGNIKKHKYTIGGALSKFNEGATSKLYGSKFGKGLLSLHQILGTQMVIYLILPLILLMYGMSTRVEPRYFKH